METLHGDFTWRLYIEALDRDFTGLVYMGGVFEKRLDWVSITSRLGSDLASVLFGPSLYLVELVYLYTYIRSLYPF